MMKNTNETLAFRSNEPGPKRRPWRATQGGPSGTRTIDAGHGIRRPVAVRLAMIFLLIGFGGWAAEGASTGTYGLNHPVSVVEADIYVNRFKTTMRLKCFAEDLETVARRRSP